MELIWELTGKCSHLQEGVEQLMVRINKTYGMEGEEVKDISDSPTTKRCRQENVALERNSYIMRTILRCSCTHSLECRPLQTIESTW